MPGSVPRGEPRWRLVVVTVFAAISWLGLFVHNLADLPGQSVLDAESLYPLLLTALLVTLWLVPATRAAGAWGLLCWGLLSLVGGGVLSVLPIGLFPFAPEQSVRHYAFHALYVLTQIPLVWATATWLLRRRRERRSAG